MKLTEVRDLLTAISGFDRKPFPEGADVAWHELLAGLDARDAHRAVIEHYGMPDARPIQAGDIRARARRLAAARAPRELPAAPVVTSRSEAARARIRELTAAAEADYRRRNPEARRYQHRPLSLVQTS